MKYTVAVAQFAMQRERKANITQAHAWIKQAAAAEANVLLLPELFEFPYFPIERGADTYFSQASSLSQHPYISQFQEQARKYELAIPFSFFERSADVYYNALAWITAAGDIAGVYRKTHIPKGMGYEEDYYFTPGCQAFPVWHSEKVAIGAGICWDQWFPEPARIMALNGAELLLYPTAIGTEPELTVNQPQYSSRFHWQQVICGHAAANVLPVAVANRVGTEHALKSELALTFYGSSFIANHEGRVVAQLAEDELGLIFHTFALDTINEFRKSWGLVQARRPELYQTLLTPLPTHAKKHYKSIRKTLEE